MPYADQPTIVLGADGFIGRHLVSTWQARGWPVHAIGRAAGDFTDRAVVDRALSAAPKAGRILHAITKQRTGKIQHAATDCAAIIARGGVRCAPAAGAL